MIALSTTAPIRFIPPWREGEPDAPCYLLRGGSVIERELLEGELDGEHRAARVYAFQLHGAFASGVDALVGEDDPDTAARLKELVAAEQALEPGEEMPADEAALLDGAREVLAEHYPAYRSLLAQAARREAIAPLVAFRRFCVGWQNVGVPFERGADGLVKLSAVEAIDPFEMRMAGRAAYGLLNGGSQAKNSAAA